MLVGLDDTMLAVRVTNFHAKCLPLYSPQNCDVISPFHFQVWYLRPEGAFQIRDFVKDCLHDHINNRRENLNVCLYRNVPLTGSSDTSGTDRLGRLALCLARLIF